MEQLPAVQLPSYLADLKADNRLSGINAAASMGISTSVGWPRIGIKSARFRLQQPQGEEIVVPTLHLDVIIVDANPNGLSKTFYLGKYDPNGEQTAPDCYSDNGVGPSSRAAKPQCGTCAACPKNAWGSKIADNGSQIKACSDTKKVAVIMADNPDGPVYELRVPPASLKNWATYVQSLDSRGIPAAGVVTRLTFDPNADYPKLMFTGTGWSSAEQVACVREVIGTEEVDVCTGKNDKPIAANAQLVAVDGNTPAAPLPPVPAAPLAFTPAAPPVPAFAPVATPPAEAPAKRTRAKKSGCSSNSSFPN